MKFTDGKILVPLILTVALIGSIMTNFTAAQTIPTIDQFTSTTSPSTAITQRTFGKAIRITGLTNGQNLCLDANGLVTTTGCTGGGGSGTVNAGTTGQLPYYAANGTTLTATSTVFVDTSSAVGIGSSTNITSGSRITITGKGSAANHILSLKNSLGIERAYFQDNGTLGFNNTLGIIIQNPVGDLTFTSGNSLSFSDAAGDSMQFGGGNLFVNTGNYNVSNSVYSDGLLNISDSGLVTLGDYNGDINGTNCYIDDSSQVISCSANSNINFQTPVVGIGTSTPTAKLAVTGSGTGTGRAFTIANSSNAEKFTVLDNGSVGIGTTSPDSALSQSSNTTGTNFHIVNSGVTNAQTLAIDFNGGNVGATTEDTAIVRVNSQSGLRPLLSMNTLNKNRFQVSAKGVTIVNNSDQAAPTVPNSFLPSLLVHTDQVSGSRPLFFGYDNTAGTGYAAYMTVGSCGSFFQLCLDMGSSTTQYSALTSFGNNLAIGGVSGATGFNAADGNAVNVFFGNTGNTLIPNGRTGVGTTTPFGTLSVTGTSTTPSLVIASSSNATQLIVTSSGNVGIGTAAPVNKLTVFGDAGPVSGFTEGQLVIYGVTNPLKRLEIGVDTSSGVMASYLQSVEVAGATRPLNLQPQGGSVAVGALPPSFAAAVFTVAATSDYTNPLTWANVVVNAGNTSKFGGTGYDTALTYASASGALFMQGFFAGSTANIPIVLAPSDGDVYIGKDGAAQKLLLPSSILGIGTKTPGARLEIVGTTTAPTAVLFNVASSSASSYLNVQSTGNVGIGTSSPTQATLEVNGSAFINTLSAAPASSRYLCADSAGGSLITVGGSGPGTDCDSSTRATKNHIGDLNINSLSIIDALKPSKFIYNEDISNTERWGFIADDAAVVDPHLVSWVDGEFKNMDKTAIMAVMWDGIRELNDRGSAAKRSAENNWYWIAIGLLGAGFVYQQIQIRNLKK